MALLKFGSLCTSGSGSVGGHTIQNSRGGIQLRNKPIPRGLASDSQRAVRNINPILQHGWVALTNAQRKIWNNYAQAPLCGHDVWMSFQYQRILEGLPFLTDPSLHKDQYLGPELIRNGGFSSSAYWTIISSWSISNGKANYLDTAINRLYQNLTFLSNHMYRIKFDISNGIGDSRLYFADVPGSNLFIAPYNTYRVFADGSYIFDWMSFRNSSNFALWSQTLGKVFSVDNLSLKIYL